jgi:hypothetical protein
MPGLHKGGEIMAGDWDVLRGGDGGLMAARYSVAQISLFRQWFDAVQDLNPAYLTAADYQLAREIYEQLGMRVPHSILEGCEK